MLAKPPPPMLRRALLAALIATAAPSPAVRAGEPAAQVAPAGADLTRLFFVTDRAPTGRTEASRRFGNRWGEVSFGTCEVRVPPRSRRGKAEKSLRPFRTPGRPSGKVRLLAVTPLSSDSFYAAIGARAAAHDSTGALVFVHGFNVPFATAARFAAQLACDLEFPGPVVLYSWPSTPSYLADEESIEWTRPHLEAALADLRRATGAPVNVLTYSIGASAVVGVIRAAADTIVTRGTLLGELVFVAPDVESRLLARELEGAARAARRVTLYASTRDRALRASRQVHQHRRAGEAGRGLLLLPGLDTIDASPIRADIMGHGYLEELAVDLHALLVDHLPPEHRAGLTRIERGDAGYWKLRRQR